MIDTLHFCPVGGVYEDVDLGLPSGTLWAKHNIGATKETECGDLFAWGCSSPFRTDGLISLDNTDNYAKCYANTIRTDLSGITDAANSSWGRGWKMPSIIQLKELIDNTTSEWVQLGGVYGRKLTSKSNKSYIFFPAAGYIMKSQVSGRNIFGGYWLSSYYNSLGAPLFSFSSNTQELKNNSRCFGYSVRAVRV